MSHASPNSSQTPKRTAVVLFNLGGPDKPDSVRPFLFNLFNDRAIIRLPSLLRFLVAKLISTRRTKKAQGIYAQIGGKSPILELTKRQAKELEYRLGAHTKVFICMRYWHPMSDEVAAEVAAYQPDHVVLLPLYPQFSSTTTASSFEDWQRAAQNVGLNVPTTLRCCYPADFHFLAAHAARLKQTYFVASHEEQPRILFSAHGLPEKVIADGDPYQWQVEQTVAALVRLLSIEGLDYRICYQSRVGPLKWIGPSTESEIEQAGAEKKPLVVVPIAFVSEHSETLVELDMEYKHLAETHGVPSYHRVPALGTQESYIEALAALARSADPALQIHPPEGKRICPRNFENCPCA